MNDDSIRFGIRNMPARMYSQRYAVQFVIMASRHGSRLGFDDGMFTRYHKRAYRRLHNLVSARRAHISRSISGIYR